MSSSATIPRPKILLLDDEQDLLDLYKSLLSQLSSQPEIVTVNNGARALSMLETESFNMLISDLRMPRMDGLQVLSIVRRKYPNLRIVVMTGIADEQFRSRAYAMGIDLFWQKPGTSQEIKLFLECIESLINKEELETGFRGVQSKSMVDLIQLESLSQSSSVLKITNGALEGRIWIQNGDVIDAATEEISGEKAFQAILGWKTGSFEILPADPGRARTIHASVHGLLLETAQNLDEAGAGEAPIEHGNAEGTQAGLASNSPLATIVRTRGVEFAVITADDKKEPLHSWRVENPEKLGEWSRKVLANFRSLGEKLQAGEFKQIEILGPQCHVAMSHKGTEGLCVGVNSKLTAEEFRETAKTALAKWAS